MVNLTTTLAHASGEWMQENRNAGRHPGHPVSGNLCVQQCRGPARGSDGYPGPSHGDYRPIGVGCFLLAAITTGEIARLGQFPPAAAAWMPGSGLLHFLPRPSSTPPPTQPP